MVSSQLHQCTFHHKLLFSVPSSPPQNVSVSAINSTSIIVSWRPPIVTDQNGQIISYNVSVVDLKDNNSASVSVLEGTIATITGILTFYNCKM